MDYQSKYLRYKKKYFHLKKQTGGNRIENIINNLLVKIPDTTEYTKATLEDRMNHYKVPGISITVVDNGKINYTGAKCVALDTFLHHI